ncbi:MAG: membrane dipeptidase [Candidatus Zhuqueibacterota bacterium]
MKKFRTTLYHWLLFSLSIFSTSFANTITGRVIDTNSDTPINQAQVIVVQTAGQTDTVFSGSDGVWTFDLTATGVSERPELPVQFQVEQNYPNPFNPATLIKFSLFEAGNVGIVVHNMLGQKLADQEQFLSAGNYAIEWRSNGAAGVYFYTLSHGKTSITKKMIQLDGGYAGGLSAIRSGSGFSTGFEKPAAPIPITLHTSKFGYIPDTLEAVAEDGSDFQVRLETIHHHALVIDLHNDILERMLESPSYHLGDSHRYWHTDIPRLQRGGVDIQFFADWVSPSQYPNNPYEISVELIALMTKEFGLNPDDIQQAFDPQDALDVVARGKIAGVLGVEGGHAIENSIEKLITLYQSGMRYLTITWNNSTDWAVSAADSRSKTVGLSEFGKQVIRTMDSLGVIIDVSHTGVKTIEDILLITKNPIVATHSGAWALRNHTRNLTDSQIQAIANSGGVVGVVFYPYFLSYSENNVNINTVISHIDYIVNLVGIDFVALGSDFDGIEIVPRGLEDVSKFPDLTLALLQRGYSQGDVEKILGLNFLRVFQQVCGK